MEPVTLGSILFSYSHYIQFFTQVRTGHWKKPNPVLDLHKVTQVDNPRDLIAVTGGGLRGGAGDTTLTGEDSGMNFGFPCRKYKVPFHLTKDDPVKVTVFNVACRTKKKSVS